MSMPMITEQRKAELVAKGYEVEDLGDEYGPDFEGQFRWVKWVDGEDVFQDHDLSYSEADAWHCADWYDNEFQLEGQAS